MPVLDTKPGTAGRSALRYRPLDTDQAAMSPLSRARRSRSDVQVAAAPIAPDPDDLADEYIPRRSRASAPQRPDPPARTRNVHRLLLISLGVLMTILLLTGSIQVANWGTNELNTLKYGNPRTFQIDAVVGHGDSLLHPSHFLAINLRGKVTIVEFPASNPGF